ncbi:MAG: hypothetical protein CSA82_02930 [Actinobacteria bacterium]|nr:MAG: hypothetical protein CSA82_02930 [Actinomycetota bacterium]
MTEEKPQVNAASSEIEGAASLIADIDARLSNLDETTSDDIPLDKKTAALRSIDADLRSVLEAAQE